MAILTQRLANSFPSWSRVRSDPASFGQRLLAPFAEIFDRLSEENILLSEYYKIYAEMLGLGNINLILLDEDDWIVKDEELSKDTYINQYIYPTKVTGYENDISYIVEKASDQADLTVQVLHEAFNLDTV